MLIYEHLWLVYLGIDILKILRWKDQESDNQPGKTQKYEEQFIG